MGGYKLILATIIGMVVGIFILFSATNKFTTNPEIHDELSTLETETTHNLNNNANSLSEDIIQLHNTQNDCWTIINNKVYDLSKYIKIHPGGNIIVKTCGIDGTELFSTKDGKGRDHSDSAKKLLEKYLVGEIGSTIPAITDIDINQDNSPTNSQENNISEPIYLECSGSATQTCSGSNGVGIKTRSCVNGVWSSWSICEIFTCNSGYKLKESECVIQIISGYTTSQTGLHNKQSDCWIIIDGNIYDVTDFISIHPGGITTITTNCGKESTNAFKTKGGNGNDHSSSAWNMLKDYLIGPVIIADSDPPVATITSPKNNAQLDAGKTNVKLSVTTNKNATCKLSNTDKSYVTMTNIFSSTGGKTHSITITNLSDGETYNEYVRCSSKGNDMNSSVTVTFSVKNLIPEIEFTAANVSTHNTQSNCWIIINNKIYDVTTYIPIHPGGITMITNSCGKEATNAFTTKGGTGSDHSTSAKNLLNNYHIKDLTIANTSTCSGNLNQSCNIENGIGVQTRTCINGALSNWSSCIANTCNSGYTLNNNQCILMLCTGTIPTRSCTVANGVGVQTATCSGSVWTYLNTPCTVSNCNLGYSLISGQCQCTGATQACNITGGTGTQTKTCTDNILGTTWTTCQVSNCNNGYKLINNQCVQQIITPYTLSQTSVHNTQSDCWIIINNKIYDVTTYIPIHPGGITMITNSCGKEATNAFTTKGGTGSDHSTSAKNLLNNYHIGDITCSGNAPTQTCTVTGGTGTQTATCNNGLWLYDGTLCQATNCNSGYILNNGQCICQGTSQSCSITNGTGIQNQTCSNNILSDNFTICTAISCNIGYTLSSGKCIETPCTGTTPTQTCTVTGGTGTQTATCKYGQYTYTNTQCQISSCTNGYTLNNNQCTCTGLTQACNITNGAGVQTKDCINGILIANWSTCQAKTCNNGYTLNNNQCIILTCSGTTPTQTCSITGGTGIQTATCNLGQWTYTGTICQANTCSAGYTLNNGQCICTGQTQTCTVTNGTGTQNRTCTNGILSATWTTCQATSCNNGYTLTNGQCTPAPCQGTAPTQTCSITGGTGTQTATCNLGQWTYTGTTCQATSCNNGYILSSGQCQCTGITQTCTVTGGTGTQNKTCTNNILGTTWTTCYATSCSNGYTLSNGQCTCTGLTRTCTVTNGVGAQNQTCTNGILSAIWTTCQATNCNTGYTLSNGQCILNTVSGYTATQVATHNTQSNCWLIITVKAYDVTTYISIHPGGVTAIASRCGTNATAAFDAIGHSNAAKIKLETFYVGNVIG